VALPLSDRAPAPRLQWPPLVVAPLAGLLLFAVGALAATLAAALGADAGPAEALGPTPWRAFPALLAADLGIWAAALLALTLGAGARTLLRRRWHLGAVLLPGGAAVIGLLLAGVGPLHVALLTWRGRLPLLSAALPPWVHVGRGFTVTPEVAADRWAPSCWVEPSEVRAIEPGPLPVPLRAHCPLLSVERTAGILAGADLGDPGLPLAVGHRWTWQHVREWRNQILWFIPDRGRTEGPILHLEVLERRDDGPLATWVLREQVEGGAANDHTIYAWDGVLRWFDAEGRPTDQVFFDGGDPSAGEAHDADGRTLVGCTFALFSESDCRCLAEPEGEARLPGPSICSRPPSAGDDLRALGSLFLGVITAGLVILDPDDDPRWILVSSSPGAAP
jgi:hypothetical protein